jgi:hypothetical protein
LATRQGAAALADESRHQNAEPLRWVSAARPRPPRLSA